MSLSRFQSTRPSRGETTIWLYTGYRYEISIHSPLAGRDLTEAYKGLEQDEFQSTRPSRGETRSSSARQSTKQFQSTRPSRGETGRCANAGAAGYISIHSPLAGRDHQVHQLSCPERISIHSPLAGRDGALPYQVDGEFQFQSTRPSRGETVTFFGFEGGVMISIHSPLAGRDVSGAQAVQHLGISIHSPLAGRDALSVR